MDTLKAIAQDPTGELFGIGMTRNAKIQSAFSRGIGIGMSNAAVGMALIAFQAHKAGRGGFVPAVVGQGAATLIGIPLAGFASAALCFVPGIGPVTAAVLGGILADYGEYRIGSQLIKSVRLFTDANKRIRHLEMGGEYKDTEQAATARFRAIQDMNASLMPGRRYLGQEARLMHR